MKNGRVVTLAGHAGLSFNIDRNNCGCATSRAFREVAAAQPTLFYSALLLTINSLVVSQISNMICYF